MSTRSCPNPPAPPAPSLGPLQLNPGGVLNHKYAGEGAVRASGLPYCVLRPTGLTNESEPGDFLLEASQGREASMAGYQPFRPHSYPE